MAATTVIRAKAKDWSPKIMRQHYENGLANANSCAQLLDSTGQPA